MKLGSINMKILVISLTFLLCLVILTDSTNITIEDATHIDVGGSKIKILSVSSAEVCLLQESFPTGTFENCVDRDLIEGFLTFNNIKLQRGRGE